MTRGKLACYANAEGRKAKSAKPQMEEMDANMDEREALIGRICVSNTAHRIVRERAQFNDGGSTG